MAEGKKTPKTAVEEVLAEPKKDDTSDVEEFNNHISQLVALFVQREVQALQQRVADLELLVGQPKGSVQFVDPDSIYDGVPWYQPENGV